jgi:hypothetical protein
MMKAWIGKSVFIIGILHSIFGLVVFRGILGGLLREGLLNTVDMQPDRNAAFWFLFGGFALLIIGGLIDWAEKKKLALPSFLRWGFAVLTVVGCVIMPKSGFWLLIVPTVGLFLRGDKAA